MSDCRFTPRSASITTGSLRIVVAALLATLGTVLFLSAGDVGAQEPGVLPEPEVLGETESAGQLPVTLGRPGDVFADNGWFDSGPAVPLMALATMGMLFVGAAIIADRCRRSAAD